jgi:hypothetical protein
VRTATRPTANEPERGTKECAYHEEGGEREGKDHPVEEGDDIGHLREEQTHLPQQNQIGVGSCREDSNYTSAFILLSFVTGQFSEKSTDYGGRAAYRG